MNKIWATTTVILAIVLTTIILSGFKAEGNTTKEYARLTIMQAESRALIVYPDGNVIEHRLPRLHRDDTVVNKKTTMLINELAKEGYTLLTGNISSLPPDRALSTELYIFVR